MNTSQIFIVIALVFNGLDFLTGITYAVKEKDIKSSKMRDGLFKKLGFCLCYILAYAVDMAGLLIDLNLPVDITPAVCLYVIVTEIVSIIENICKINPDIMPDKLLGLFGLDDREG